MIECGLFRTENVPEVKRLINNKTVKKFPRWHVSRIVRNTDRRQVDVDEKQKMSVWEIMMSCAVIALFVSSPVIRTTSSRTDCTHQWGGRHYVTTGRWPCPASQRRPIIRRSSSHQTRRSSFKICLSYTVTENGTVMRVTHSLRLCSDATASATAVTVTVAVTLVSAVSRITRITQSLYNNVRRLPAECRGWSL